MLLNIVWLVGSLFVLTFGADLLVRGAVRVAKRLGVSSFFIGLTIVGFGTSAPELATGLTAVFQGLHDINLGNVVGSNIFNIALILGVTALVCPIPVQTNAVRGEMPLLIGVAFVPLMAPLTGGRIPWWVGVLLFAGLVVFITRGYFAGRQESQAEVESERALERQVGAVDPKRSSTLKSLLLIGAGLVLLVAGSKLLVFSAVAIARELGISELVIALTIISAGTSAPELFTSLVAGLKKQPDIAVGNILGSNIFNVLGILGITSMVREQTISPQIWMMDTPVMIFLSIALAPILFSHSRISRAEGVFLLLCYAGYLAMLFFLAPIWFGS